MAAAVLLSAYMARVLRVGLLCALVLGDLLPRASGCFNRDTDIAQCMRENNISIPLFRGPTGFDFGWGSVDQTEEMCQTRGHIRTLICMKNLVNRRCVGTSSFLLKRLLLDAVFDVKPYTRAANYLCHAENMQIFMENRECLKKQEGYAELCSKRKTQSMSEAMEDLRSKAQGGSAPSQAMSYRDFVYKIMHQHQCSGQVASMRCIFTYIHTHCNKRIVLLLMNYYKELLPDDCVLTFDYESILKNVYEPSNDQSRPVVNTSRIISSEIKNYARNAAASSPASASLAVAGAVAVVTLARTMTSAASS